MLPCCDGEIKLYILSSRGGVISTTTSRAMLATARPLVYEWGEL